MGANLKAVIHQEIIHKFTNMANHTTGAQRYNKRMDDIFARSEAAGHHTLHASSEAKTQALKSKMHRKVKKEFNLSKGNIEYRKKHFSG